MTKGFLCCLRKDVKEVLRGGKLIVFGILIAAIAILILCSTLVFSDMPEALWQQLPGFDIDALEGVISSLYPRNVRENVGIFAYYIGLFYSIGAILVTFNILPKEREQGKWILPRQQGYSGSEFVFSKCLVYGLFAGGCVFAGYLLYYLAANLCMERNMPLGNAIALALIHCINLCIIICYTQLFSVLWKNPVIAAVSMISTIIFVPDIAGYLSFGKMLPTYLLTFVYDSCSSYGDVIVPLTENLAILVLLGILTDMKMCKEDGMG
ncbi:MAG: hypothetical protein K5739_04010 [Lachnospiraceae bacterium]|nr:hypothetical protein [Lachnospiraceae bacterium]